jgi:hypothetical protein
VRSEDLLTARMVWSETARVGLSQRSTGPLLTRHSLNPTSVSGAQTVDFPGGTGDLANRFTLRDNLIASLEIAPPDAPAAR